MEEEIFRATARDGEGVCCPVEECMSSESPEAEVTETGGTFKALAIKAKKKKNNMKTSYNRENYAMF